MKKWVTIAFVLILSIFEVVGRALSNSSADQLWPFLKSIALWTFIGTAIVDIISTIVVSRLDTTTGETRPSFPRRTLGSFFLALGILAAGANGLASNFVVIELPRKISKIAIDLSTPLLGAGTILILIISIVLYNIGMRWFGPKDERRAFLRSLRTLYEAREHHTVDLVAHIVDPTGSMNEKERNRARQAALKEIEPGLDRLTADGRQERGLGGELLYALYLGDDDDKKNDDKKKRKGLLIQGDAGAGKTTYLVKLALKLVCDQEFIAKRNGEYKFPVIFSLASWAVHKKSLEEWMIDELASEAYGMGHKRARAWVKGNLILPLLDGLNEATWQYFGACIQKIKQFQDTHPKTPLVLCYRSTSPDETDDGDTNGKYFKLDEDKRLDLPAVEVQPLTDTKILKFLEQGPGLEDIQQALKDDPELLSEVTTPLILIAMALVYRKGTLQKEIPRLENGYKAWLQVIWNDYVQEMICRPHGVIELLADAQGRPGSPTHRWRRRQAHPRSETLVPDKRDERETRHYLAWLAAEMTKHEIEDFHLEDLQWDWLPNPPEGERPAIELTGNRTWSRLPRYALGIVLLFSLIVGVPVGLFVAADHRLGNAITSGTGYGLLFGFMLGLLVIAFSQLGSGTMGFRHQSIKPKELPHPEAGVRQSLKNGWIGATVVGLSYIVGVGLAYGLGVVLVGGFAAALSQSLTPEVPMIGVVIGLGVGLLMGIPSAFLAWDKLGGSAYMRYQKLQQQLKKQQAIPDDFISFLDFVEDRALLRRVGGGYSFFHGLLRDYFAEEWEKTHKHERLPTDSIALSDREVVVRQP